MPHINKPSKKLFSSLSIMKLQIQLILISKTLNFGVTKLLNGNYKHKIADYLDKSLYLNGGIDLNELNIINATKCVYDYTAETCISLKDLSKKIFEVCLNHVDQTDCKQLISSLQKQGVLEVACSSSKYMQTEACRTRWSVMVSKEIMLRSKTMENETKAKIKAMGIEESLKKWKTYKNNVKRLEDRVQNDVVKTANKVVNKVNKEETKVEKKIAKK